MPEKELSSPLIEGEDPMQQLDDDSERAQTSSTPLRDHSSL
jgi:hypothetical protein